MYTMINSACIWGISAAGIRVEVDISGGLPHVSVVGLPDPSVRESIDRVRAAIRNSRFSFPLDRITINLAPADFRKDGTSFDLAIAAGILAASGQINATALQGALLVGELSLDGCIRPVTGMLAIAETARSLGLTKLLLPSANWNEASCISGLQLYPIARLEQLTTLSDSNGLEILLSQSQSQNQNQSQNFNKHETTTIESLSGIRGQQAELTASPYVNISEEIGDYEDVAGQYQAKRALLIAAAGGHHLLFTGPPGTGKTMMIRRLPTIMPELTEQQALEATRIHRVTGKLGTQPGDWSGLLRKPPFRSPHHTVTAGGLIGGGAIPRPGEVTLAHHGILFLDELTEFSRSILDMLRQPLEDRMVTLARSRAVFQYPADFLLAAACNPESNVTNADSNLFADKSGSLTQTNSTTETDLVLSDKQKRKLSGPLLDRIDLVLDVPLPLPSELQGHSRSHKGSAASTMTSASMRAQVVAARERMTARIARLTLENTGFSSSLHLNSRLPQAHLLGVVDLTSGADKLLAEACTQLNISMRSRSRIIRIARTIADLEDKAQTTEYHVAEALQYKQWS